MLKKFLVIRAHKNKSLSFCLDQCLMSTLLGFSDPKVTISLYSPFLVCPSHCQDAGLDGPFLGTIMTPYVVLLHKIKTFCNCGSSAAFCQYMGFDLNFFSPSSLPTGLLSFKWSSHKSPF